MRWPWQQMPELRSDPFLSIGDPILAGYFGMTPTYAGVAVGEGSVLGISAVYRACSLISGTIASLPLKTYRDTADGERQQMSSFLDDPGTPDGLTPFAWKETVLWHLLLHGNAYLAHVLNQGGALAGLTPIHPSAVSPEWKPERPGGKLFTASLADGTRTEFDATTMTQIMGPTLDGLRGMSVISVARNSLGTTIAGDRAAAKMFSGAMISGLVTPDEDVDEDEARAIKAGLDQKMSGWEHAGELAFVNRKLNFTPWQMSAEDAQFLQSRQFQIEEIARWYGVPPFELMQTEKQTSWGTGIESQQRGLARGVLLGWTTRIEQALSRLLPAPRFCEFDFAGLERPTPVEEIRLLLEQIRGGLITINEARAIRNLPPIEGADVLAEPKGTASVAAPEGAEAVV